MLRQPSVSSLVTVLCFPLLIVGCTSESDPTSPQIVSRDALLQPQGTWQGKANLNSMWPNDDTRMWTFRQQWGSCGFNAPPIYDDPSSVPPAPPIEEIIPLLAYDVPPWFGGFVGPGPCDSEDGIYRLHFMGEITTASGVTAQNLVASYQTSEEDPGRRVGTSNESAFMTRLRKARPDLFAPAGETLRDDPHPMLSPSLLLPGGAWQKTAEAIVLYGDRTPDAVWQYLGAEVKPGSQFAFQLVPDLADDIFLHALVVARSQQRKIKGYQREIEVAYLIDYGVLTVVGPAGEILGYFRRVDYGSVVYVPGVGPVFATERLLATSDDVSKAPQFLTLNLTGNSAGGFVPGGVSIAD